MTNADEAKGRVKRAAGELTDDEKLKREGSVDKAAGAAKRTVDKAADTAKEGARPEVTTPSSSRAPTDARYRGRSPSCNQ